MYKKLFMPFDLSLKIIGEELLKNKECEFRFIMPGSKENFKGYRDNILKPCLNDDFKITSPKCNEFGFVQLKFTPKREELKGPSKEWIKKVFKL